MEQKTGPNTPPIPPAGVDPAYIPGLTPPARSAAEAPAPVVDDDAPEDAPLAAPETEPEPAPEAAPEAAVEAVAEDTDTDTADDEDASEEDTGAVFSVSDRRGSITADRTGITFKLDGESADFGWDEIGAVEIDTPRFGRRFSVTVYTSTRRWFDTDVEAPSKPLLKTWAAELDAVLDTYFEDDKPDATEEVEEAAEADATDEADEKADEKKAKATEDAEA
ncbi:hypothetical protein [Streptomyces sp. CBMA29]|uniref:hypothetical protein n=1 Tax=Streptomyces sp. CBMA29 TaxID=1896314 RepID=UPI001661AC11|nr:hypothetical protein [Streptomyces sp. CBMA29]MBD0737185.1 hypothetical protein [Streptomyces sp. CBMA29]